MRLLPWLLIFVASSVPTLARDWQFSRVNDLQGWSVSQELRPVVMGGSIWISIRADEKDPTQITTTGYQVAGDASGPIGAKGKWFEPMRELLASPRGLNLSAAADRQIQLRIELINLSPVTDVFLQWRTQDRPGKYSGSRRCTLKADLKAWQTVTCYADPAIRGPIDQLALEIPVNVPRGDLWIRRIGIVAGERAPSPERPNLASPRVVPRISIPGITQADFADAFRVLDECLVDDVPLYGFTHPIFTPDGHGAVYGESWWEEDASVEIAGAKWANPSFAQDAMRGFHDLQAGNPDGRFDSFGWATVRGQVADESQSPQYFEVAYDVARRSDDSELRAQILETMQKYLDWWLSPVKRDPKTGLISGIGEESFGQVENFEIQPQAWAPLDLNVWVALGADLTAKLAASLHRDDLATRDTEAFQALSQAINAYLWDEKHGAYYEYDLRKGQRAERLWVSTFFPLRLAIAPPIRRDRLLKRLLDPGQFNWGKVPLPTLAMTDPEFKSTTLTQTARSHYNWTGDVWMVTNMPVVWGLRESGREDLAAELNWAFVKEFNHNYRETLLPMNGQGIGALRYGESASLYIQGIIEHLFGIDYDAIEQRLRIRPLVPKALYGRTLSIQNIILPVGGTRLSVQVMQSSARRGTVTVDLTGRLPGVNLEMGLPGSPKRITAPATYHFVAHYS